MPLTDKGEKIMASLKEEYGAERVEQVFYAGANKGTFTGVHDGSEEEKFREVSAKMDALLSRADAFFEEQPAQSVGDAGPIGAGVGLIVKYKKLKEELMKLERTGPTGPNAKRIKELEAEMYDIVVQMRGDSFTADDLTTLNDAMRSDASDRPKEYWIKEAERYEQMARNSGSNKLLEIAKAYRENAKKARDSINDASHDEVLKLAEKMYRSQLGRNDWSYAPASIRKQFVDKAVKELEGGVRNDVKEFTLGQKVKIIKKLVGVPAGSLGKIEKIQRESGGTYVVRLEDGGRVYPSSSEIEAA